jgi:hypothetical protein
VTPLDAGVEIVGLHNQIKQHPFCKSPVCS